MGHVGLVGWNPTLRAVPMLVQRDVATGRFEGGAVVSLPFALLPGIKARMRRRGAPDRPLGRALPSVRTT
jgi:hypothetical protein